MAVLEGLSQTNALFYQGLVVLYQLLVYLAELRYLNNLIAIGPTALRFLPTNFPKFDSFGFLDGYNG
jgi:hypothetical protein